MSRNRTEREEGTLDTDYPDDGPLDAESLARVGQPKGTLAIVLIYAALFALGWAFLYVVEFLPRGAPHL